MALDDNIEIIDLDKEEEREDKPKIKLGSLDKYISVTYLWMHMLMISLYTVLLMLAVIFLNQRYMWHIFMSASIIFMVSLWGIYGISKKIKKKKNKLNEHKVRFIWQTAYIALSIIWMCVISMICGLAQVAVMF